MDGNVFFPPPFASQEFRDLMEKRRESGIRKRVPKLKPGSQGPSSPKLNLVATRAENQVDESQCGLNEIGRSSQRNHLFIESHRH